MHTHDDDEGCYHLPVADVLVTLQLKKNHLDDTVEVEQGDNLENAKKNLQSKYFLLHLLVTGCSHMTSAKIGVARLSDP